MQIVFEQEYLADLYYYQTSDKKHRFQPEVIKKYTKVVNILKFAKSVKDLMPFNSLKYEKLLGDKQGIESVRVTNKYRLESQKDFAKCIGVPYTMFNDILNQRRPLSVTIALLVEQALGIPADLLIGLQTDYSMQRARNDESIKKRMRAVQQLSTRIPTVLASA